LTSEWIHIYAPLKIKGAYFAQRRRSVDLDGCSKGGQGAYAHDGKLPLVPSCKLQDKNCCGCFYFFRGFDCEEPFRNEAVAFATPLSCHDRHVSHTKSMQPISADVSAVLLESTGSYYTNDGDALTLSKQYQEG
jgi:hypothetical protein